MNYSTELALYRIHDVSSDRKQSSNVLIASATLYVLRCFFQLVSAAAFEISLTGVTLLPRQRASLCLSELVYLFFANIYLRGTVFSSDACLATLL
jgi:hypothetical protein